jgi:hypothetical protein
VANEAVHLTCTQYADLCKVVLRTLRNTFVAIKDQGIPLIDELLPLCTSSPIVLVSLLSLAAEIRARKNDKSATETSYDTALAAVQRDATTLGDDQWSDPVQIQILISTAIILALLSFSGPGDNWHRHTSRIVSLIDCLDLRELRQKRRGLFLIMTAAAFDVSAFSVGKIGPSINAWQRWCLDQLPASESITPGDTGHVPLFLPFEVLTGYPHSLVSLIVCASQMAESHSDNRGLRNSTEGDTGRAEAAEQDARLLGVRIETWEPPPLPPDFCTLQEQALRTAWRAIQKSAIIYHMRRRGFRANVLVPLTGSDNLHQVRNMIDGVLLGLRWLMLVWKSDGIPIANAMTWPIAVIGCECGGPDLEEQTAQLRQVIDAVEKSFGMGHLAMLRKVLDLIWTQKQQEHQQQQLDAQSVVTDRFMSLELAANIKGYTVPLF